MEQSAWDAWHRKLGLKIKAWLEQKTDFKDKRFYCKHCGLLITGTNVSCPIHDSFTRLKGEHAGSGKTYRFDVPLCANELCPGHRPPFIGELAIEANNTLHGPCIDI